jgi:aryl-alcohol dehydrogenase-like predicted oxidoreductase
MHDTDRTRRTLLRAGLAAALAAGATACAAPVTTHALAATGADAPAGRGTGSPAAGPVVTRPIPRTGEPLPVVGLGTNRFGVETAELKAPLRDVLRRMVELGGRVVDTAPAYGRSEEVLGELIAETGLRERLFLATKITAADGDLAAAKAMLAASRARLRTERFDLLQVHSLRGVDVLLPLLRDERAAGRIRYLGVTTSADEQYQPLLDVMAREQLDFVQVDYSLGNRGAAERILPLARERGIGVLVNLPLGGRRASLLPKLAGRPLPDFAAEFDATTWPQVLLKYVLGHPAVTVVIPGSTRIAHLEDNQRAARGRLPTAEHRRRLEAWWDSLPGASSAG